MISDQIGDSSSESQGSGVSLFFHKLSQDYQRYLDATTPYTVFRWISAAVLALIFMCRIVWLQGWYIIAYALGIYHLNLFIAFLSPKIDPAFQEFVDDSPGLPSTSRDVRRDEFRPFMRRLPEFKFWLGVMRSTLIGIFCTFFDALNIPVFWPILVMYFVTLFGLTMKRQIKHMIKYRYIPFTTGKPKYATPSSGLK